MDRADADSEFVETGLDLFFVVGVGEGHGGVGDEGYFVNPGKEAADFGQRIAQIFFAGIGRIRDQKQFHNSVILKLLCMFLC